MSSNAKHFMVYHILSFKSCAIQNYERLTLSFKPSFRQSLTYLLKGPLKYYVTIFGHFRNCFYYLNVSILNVFFPTFYENISALLVLIMIKLQRQPSQLYIQPYNFSFF